VCGSKSDIEALAAALEVDPKVEVKIDLETMTVSYGDVSFTCTMPDSAREALISARWDPIAELLESSEAIEAKAEALPYV
jgi:3-isopropylmalate/(R)-2-methylmalate dehydratase small subunit